MLPWHQVPSPFLSSQRLVGVPGLHCVEAASAMLKRRLGPVSAGADFDRASAWSLALTPRQYSPLR